MVQLQANAEGGHDHREVNLGDRNMNLDNLFLTEVGRSRFYTQIKNDAPASKTECDKEKLAIVDYRSIQGKNMMVPCPNFVTVTQHNLLLFQ